MIWMGRAMERRGDERSNMCLTCIPASPQVQGIQMQNDNATSETLQGLRNVVTVRIKINYIS